VCLVFCLGVVHKGRPRKSRKVDHLPHCPQNVRTGSTTFSPCPCGYKINLKKSEVFVSECADVRIWRIPLVHEMFAQHGQSPCPLSVHVLYGRCLIWLLSLLERYLLVYLLRIKLGLTALNSSLVLFLYAWLNYPIYNDENKISVLPNYICSYSKNIRLKPLQPVSP